MSVICPACGSIASNHPDEIHTVEYNCPACNHEFFSDGFGNIHARV